MPMVIVVDRAGETTEVQTTTNVSVMEVIRDDGGFDELLAVCGGSCSCATCHVYVDPAWTAATGPATADEDDLLEGSAHRQANSRLSCQITMTAALDGLRVTIAPED